MQIMGGGKGGKKEKNDQALKNAQPHMLNVNGIVYIRTVSSYRFLSALMNQNYRISANSCRDNYSFFEACV